MIRQDVFGAVLATLITATALAGCGNSSGTMTSGSTPKSPRLSPSATAAPNLKAGPSLKADASTTVGEPKGARAESATPTKGGGSTTAGEPKGARAESATPTKGGGSTTAGEPKGARAESATPTKAGKQTAVLDRVPGSGSTTCQRVDKNQRDLRAGGFVVGPFDTARSMYGKKQPNATRSTIRLYWVPLNTQPMGGLTLKLTNLGTGKSRVITQEQVADAEQWKFYDTQLELVQSGTWRVEASSGPDHGCVIFTLPKV